MNPFIYTSLPVRVVFGHGTLAQVGAEVTALNAKRALVLSTPNQKTDGEKLLASLGDLGVGLYSNATMHTPTDVTEQALEFARAKNADCLVSLGGGSTTGLGKAIALRTDLPQIAVPTTYAGSEATPIIGETRDGMKTTQSTRKVLPETIVYDVDLTLGLPTGLSVTSGVNAIAHAVEALYARDGNPIISQLARDGIRSIGKALPTIVADPRNLQARSDALFGAWACGTCLGNVGMALHHKLCHVLGGTFNLPHAETHTVILPHALAYNAKAAAAAAADVAASLGVSDPAAGLYDLSTQLGAPRSLKELGMREEDLGRAADIAVQNPYWNPRAIERQGIEELLRNAFDGRRPKL